MLQSQAEIQASVVLIPIANPDLVPFPPLPLHILFGRIAPTIVVTVTATRDIHAFDGATEIVQISVVPRPVLAVAAVLENALDPSILVHFQRYGPIGNLGVLAIPSNPYLILPSELFRSGW
jgi:hypothetical protein